MKIQANVKRVGELKTGTSKTTGKKWAIREILFSWTDEAGENFVSATVDGDLFTGQGIDAGSTIQVELTFHTRLLPSGAVANEVRVINVNENDNENENNLCT